MKLVTDLPAPPPITEEVKRRLLEESKEWAAEIRKKIRAMENLTPEDWATRVR
jgi:hypothetical protein